MAGITSTKKIKGQKHFLAYITPSEAEILEKSGGKKTMTKEGVPAYPPSNDARGESRGRGPEAGNGGNADRDDGGREEGTTTESGQTANQSSNKNKTKDEDRRQTGNVDKKNVKTGPKKTDTKTVTGKDTGKGSSYEKAEKKFKEAVDDYTKAQKISGYKPFNLNYLPVIGPTRKIFGTPFTIKGKTNMAKRRMEYINSLPPAQRKAMIDRLGYAVDEEYDELDEQALSKAGLGVFNPEDVNPNFKAYGNTDDPNFKTLQLTDDPLSYVGENPIYGPDAMDIINYDGEYLKKYGPDLGGGSGGDDPIIYTNTNTGTNTGTTDDTTDDEVKYDYRFGNPNANTALDVTLGRYFNQGGRVPRNMGGIMNAVPRQGYFLGKIVKGVKKVVGGVADAAGKVLKSDFGKAAVMALGGYYLGGGTALGGAKMFGNTGFGSAGFLSNLGRLKTYVKDNPFKSIGIASMALPFIPGINKVPENEDIGMADRGGSLIDPITGEEALPSQMRASLNDALDNADGDPAKIKQIQNAYAFLTPDERLGTYLPYRTYGVKDGGRIGRAEGGLMNLGGMEKDYRAEGGFVPIGKEEKADDVPARLSVNEFVFTADAVRNAGGGDIDRGAEVMENMMKNLENGGRVSEESQGNTGAQDMFSVSERIGEVI